MVVKAICSMNIYKKSFEQKDKSAKHRKYSLTKAVTVAGDDIDLRQNKLTSLYISKSKNINIGDLRYTSNE